MLAIPDIGKNPNEEKSKNMMLKKTTNPMIGITKMIPDCLNDENFPSVSTAALCVGLIIFNPEKITIIPIIATTIKMIRDVSRLDPPPGARREWIDRVLAQHAFVVLVFYRGFW